MNLGFNNSVFLKLLIIIFDKDPQPYLIYLKNQIKESIYLVVH